MRKLFLVFFLCVIGCAKKLPPQQFVLEGTVRLDREVKEEAKVKLEVCKHTEWIEDSKWETTTDKWGRYEIIVGMDWFGEYYRVKASAYDKYHTFYISDWQYGVVRFSSTDKKDIWLGGKQVEEAKKKRRRF